MSAREDARLWLIGPKVNARASVPRSDSSSALRTIETHPHDCRACRLLIASNERNKTAAVGKEVNHDEWIGTALAMALVMTPWVSPAVAGEGVVSKDELTPQSYCHMKLPALRPRTLGNDQPEAKRSDTGDVVDFYGPCDESPTSSDQVIDQRDDEQHHWRDYQN